MAVFAVSITKRMTWRGQNQEFSNVYHYKTGVGTPFDDALAVADIVAAEKACHTTDITFQVARTWGPTDGSQAASVTREIIDLTGTGVRTPLATFYKELAILVVWPLGRYGSRNRPQFLRKWLHLGDQAGISTTNWSSGSVTATANTVVTNYINAVDSVGPGPYDICAKGGEEPISAGSMYPYLEHRQLGR